MSTDVGDVVFDPFMGTGTTAIAAKRLGRHYIGSELDEKYAAIATDKAKETKPTKIKNVHVSEYLGTVVTIRDIDAERLMEKEAPAAPATPAKRRQIPATPAFTPALLERKSRYRSRA